ncbi:MAG: LysR family transcriptional regulator [Betaproteobacteria bacterium]|nr:LysR family transcriptional regulator [Betaproteobacteria bacterium]
MKKRTPHWEDLLTLAVLARSGNYSAAARELGLTHATIGRRIERLEAALGTVLAARRDTGLQLTDAGRMALAAAGEMEQAAEGLYRTLEAHPAGLSGRIRITTLEALGTYFYLPRLVEFHRRHPGIMIEMTLDARTLSLAKRKADLAIRLARPSEPGLVAKRLGSMGYGLYMRRDHPALLSAGGKNILKSPGTLPICRFDESLAELPESRWIAERLPQAHCVFRANSLMALAQAVRFGWGAGLIPRFLAQAAPELVCLTDGVAVSREIWLAYPAEFRDVPRYRAVIDSLVAATNDAAGLLAG